MYTRLLETVYQYCVGEQPIQNTQRLEQSFEELLLKENEDLQNWKIRRANQQLQYVQDLSIVFDTKIMFMKGIFMVQELYGNIYDRTSGDIDILVRPENALEIGDYLLMRGFTCEVPREQWVQTLEYRDIAYIQHLNDIIFVIEMHQKPVYSVTYGTDELTNIWNRAFQQPIFDANPLVMDRYDQLLYHILHYLKHASVYEMHTLLQRKSALKAKHMVDIYVMLTNPNMNMSLVAERIQQTGHTWECYIVIQLIHDIFRDSRTKHLLCTLSANMNTVEQSPQYFWRYTIPLRDTITKFFSNCYCDFIIPYISYDYSRTLRVTQEYQCPFTYTDARVQFACRIGYRQGLHIEFDIIRLNDMNWNGVNILIHYHMHKHTQQAYLRKLIIGVQQAEDHFACTFRDNIFREEYEIPYCLRVEHNHCVLHLHLNDLSGDDELITYSVTYHDIDGKDTCVSGTRWDDFSTMRHLEWKNTLELEESDHDTECMAAWYAC